MKYSLVISKFLEEIANLSHSFVFLYFFALITEEGFLISPCYFLELCIQMGISFLFSFAFFFSSASAKSLQSCPTLCDPIDSSLPGSSVPGIFQARTLEWDVIAFSYDQPRKHIERQRHHFVIKGPSSQVYGFSSGQVWM